MAKFGMTTLACLIAIMFVATEASARWNGHNSGVCKSGKRTFDVKLCKENGGKR